MINYLYLLAVVAFRSIELITVGDDLYPTIVTLYKKYL